MVAARFLSVAAFAFALWPSASRSAEIRSCQANYQLTSQHHEESPGALWTKVNTPCRISVRLVGAVRGAPLGVGRGFTVLQPPHNGSVRPEGYSAFVFTPKNGFSGNDAMVVQFNWRNGGFGKVRFAVNVN
jgi:hypothetical protein